MQLSVTSHVPLSSLISVQHLSIGFVVPSCVTAFCGFTHVVSLLLIVPAVSLLFILEAVFLLNFNFISLLASYFKTLFILLSIIVLDQ
jgi:hypothetical protein